MSESRSQGVRGAILLVLLALVVAACGSGSTSSESSTTTASAPTGFAGYVRSPPLDVSSVTLPAVDGTPVQMVADPGDLMIAYFGYTSCPDICPMSLSNVKTALARQPVADRDRVQVAVITVDPSVDTGKVLAAYVKRYFPDGHAIRTDDPTVLRSAAKVFGADYRIRMNNQGKREVSHSADLYVIDDSGTVVLAWPFGVNPDDIANDLARLLRGDRPDAQGR